MNINILYIFYVVNSLHHCSLSIPGEGSSSFFGMFFLCLCGGLGTEDVVCAQTQTMKPTEGHLWVQAIENKIELNNTWNLLPLRELQAQQSIVDKLNA